MAEGTLAAGSVRAAWGAWAGQSVDLAIPAGWRTLELSMRGAPALTTEALDAALTQPVGAARLDRLAEKKSRAVIAVDDITRPTRTAPILEWIVNTLLSSGMPASAITVLVATGAHRAATADDVQLKAGALAGRVTVLSHDPIADVVETGVTLGGQPVRVNRAYLDADLRIGIGGVMPHPFAGYSGGGKIVLPGLADLDSVVRSHKYALMGFGGGPDLEGNRFRGDMERAVRQIGIDWTVNVVLNDRCDTVGVVAGDVVEAHRLAAGLARQIGETPAPDVPLDALLLNAYPKDSELLQIEAALVAVRAGMVNWLRPAAPVVLLAACPDGRGSHQLFGPGGRLFRPPAPKRYLSGRALHVVSPATADDAEHAVFSREYQYHQRWDDCAAALAATLPPAPVLGFAPSGPLHVPCAAGWAS